MASNVKGLEHATGVGQVIEMGVRIYQPALGRFLAVDPVAGGNANDYIYPADPINAFDLDGRCSYLDPLECLEDGVAALASGASKVVVGTGRFVGRQVKRGSKALLKSAQSFACDTAGQFCDGHLSGVGGISSSPPEVVGLQRLLVNKVDKTMRRCRSGASNWHDYIFMVPSATLHGARAGGLGAHCTGPVVRLSRQLHRVALER